MLGVGVVGSSSSSARLMQLVQDRTGLGSSETVARTVRGGESEYVSEGE